MRDDDSMKYELEYLNRCRRGPLADLPECIFVLSVGIAFNMFVYWFLFC